MTESEKVENHLGDLMSQAQAGDSAAYTELLQEVTSILRRFFRKYAAFLRDQDLEDLVQETLLSVHVVRATYDPSRPFMPWLLAIARNRFVDGARRYSRQGAREVAIDDPDVTFKVPGANTIKEVFGNSQALRRAIDELPPGQRGAIEMLKLREMSLKDASEASGISIAALKVATYRAMNALRRLLKEP